MEWALIEYNHSKAAQMSENHSLKRGPLRKNAMITLQRREKLVERVLRGGEGLTKVSEELKIKLSTAKLILNRYRRTGTFFESRRLRAARFSQEQQSREVFSGKEQRSGQEGSQAGGQVADRSQQREERYGEEPQVDASGGRERRVVDPFMGAAQLCYYPQQVCFLQAGPIIWGLF